MSAFPMTGGEGSSQPGRRTRRPRAKRKPQHRFLMQLMPDGSFRAADGASRRKLKAAGFQRGQELIAYLYRVRDPVQWRRAHVLGELLCQNHDAFNGMQAHDALKKLQVDGKIACHEEKFDVELPNGLGRVSMTRLVPESLEFGNLDDGEFSAIFRQMCEEAKKYFGDIDADAVEQMLMLMPDPA